MWFFLAVMFALATAVTLVKASLLERNHNWLLVILGTAMTPLAFAPIAVRISGQSLTAFVNNYAVLADVCTVLVAESFIMLLLAAHMINAHYGGGNRTWGKAICLLPSIGCVAGLCVLLTFLYNTPTVRSFALLAVGFAGGVLLLLLAGSAFLRFVFKDWVGRLEIMLIASFLQLVAAMFLPLIAGGLSPPDHLVQPDWTATVACAVCALAGAMAGYLWHARSQLYRGNASS